MEPAKPPLPWLRYLPFHPATGIHTSILMLESAAGLISAAMRQNAGSSLKIAGFGIGLGSSNAPAATVCAEVIVVSGSFRLPRLSQGTACAGIAPKAMMITTIHVAKNVVTLA